MRGREQARSVDAGSVVCDLSAVERPDVATVDALARLRVAARRLGCTLVLRNAGRELCELIDLVGLADILAIESELGLEPERQTEQREEALGVEEERDAADPIARDLEHLE